MPNYCYGDITFHTHNTEELNTILNAIHGTKDGEELIFDFNKIIPMPKELNAVDSGLDATAFAAYICDGQKISHEEYYQRAHSSRLKGLAYEQLTTKAVLKDFQDIAYSRFMETEDAQIPGLLNIASKLLANIQRYGFPDWYEWRCENWGTKWNSFDVQAADNNISFYTAWSPCSPIVKQLSVMFPDVIIEYHYEEPGCCFCGCEIYSAGRKLYNMDAEYSEYWLCDLDYEEDSPHYEDGFYEKKIQVLDETARYLKGKISICTHRDECIYQIDGQFVDCGVEELGITPYDYR